MDIVYLVSAILGMVVSLFALIFPLFFFKKTNSKLEKVLIIVICIWGLLFLIINIFGIIGLSLYNQYPVYLLVIVSFTILAIIVIKKK